MSENITGLVKIIGITVLLIILWVLLAVMIPDRFLTANNLGNLLRRTALFGILGIGVAFVIISSGIDLSIGSLVCLSACLFALFLNVSYVPMGEADVRDIDLDNNSLLVSSRNAFSEGDDIWFIYNKRVRGVLRVNSVDQNVSIEGSTFDRLHFEGDVRALARMHSRIDEMDMKIYPTYAIKSIQDETTVELDESVPKLAGRSLLRFVSGNQMKERVIAGPASAGYQLESPVTGVSDFRVVPVLRKQFMSIPIALLSVLGIALGLGLCHGLLITKFNQQPFIITLCGLLIYRGVARRFTNDQPVGFIEYSDSLGAIASGRLILSGEGSEAFAIPYSFFFLLILMVLAIVFLNYTVWGRYLKALGRNEEAARYSGINTSRITILAYVICAMLAAVGGMMFAIDANSVPPSSFGNFYELYAIAAAVLGGCSLRGGEGSILGVVVGTALMQTLNNSIILLGIPDTLEFTLIGSVILIGVVSDELVRRLASRFRRSR